ncbi:MAG: hypothetical protein ACR2KK_03705 [Acidimicrobiales bacterium]
MRHRAVLTAAMWFLDHPTDEGLSYNGQPPDGVRAGGDDSPGEHGRGATDAHLDEALAAFSTVGSKSRLLG